MMGYNIEFYPNYLKYKYIFFFISISGRIRSRIQIRNFFSAEPDTDPWKKIPDPHPWFKVYTVHYSLMKIQVVLCSVQYSSNLGNKNRNRKNWIWHRTNREIPDLCFNQFAALFVERISWEKYLKKSGVRIQHTFPLDPLDPASWKKILIRP